MVSKIRSLTNVVSDNSSYDSTLFADAMVFPALLSLSTGTSSACSYAPLAGYLVDALKPSCVVDLGSHDPSFYLTLCHIVSHLDLPTRGFFLHALRAGDPKLDELQKKHDRLYGAFSQLVSSDKGAHFSTLFADGGIDFLHLSNGGPNSLSTLDPKNWWSKLSKQAVVTVERIGISEEQGGLSNLWADLKTRRPSFEFMHDGGLGLLFVGEAVPGPLRVLLEASDDYLAKIRRLFFALGELAGAKNKLLVLEQQSQGYKDETEKLKQKAAALAQEQKDFEHYKRKQTAEKDENKTYVASLKNAIETQKRLLIVQQQQMDELKKLVFAQEQRIASIGDGAALVLIQKYRGAKEKLLPHGTARRLTYEKVLHFLKTSDIAASFRKTK